ncbi:Clp protease ClpP, partial [Paraburkholderia sp. SIMBA_050]
MTNAQGAAVAEIRIYDEIGFWGTDAKTFIAQLDAAAASATEVIVAVNSPGGDVFDAFAIYNALRRYAGKVTARVDGVAASAAGLVVMAGDQVVMPENAMLMIHNPWTIALGSAADLRSTADMMDKARDGILAAYRRK